jgi:hypothetical protein
VRAFAMQIAGLKCSFHADALRARKFLLNKRMWGGWEAAHCTRREPAVSTAAPSATRARRCG